MNASLKNEAYILKCYGLNWGSYVGHPFKSNRHVFQIGPVRCSGSFVLLLSWWQCITSNFEVNGYYKSTFFWIPSGFSIWSLLMVNLIYIFSLYVLALTYSALFLCKPQICITPNRISLYYTSDEITYSQALQLFKSLNSVWVQHTSEITRWCVHQIRSWTETSTNLPTCHRNSPTV